MNASFSVAYRVPGLVDVLMPKQEGVAGYRLKAATNFDVAFQTILTANKGAGFLDPAVPRGKLHRMPGNHVRAVFDPQTFNGTVGIADTDQFWLKFAPVDAAGVEGAESDPVLVLAPHQHKGAVRVVIAGEAPVAADVSGSLRLLLGRRMTNLVIQNRGNALFVAFSPNSPEIEVNSNDEYTYHDSVQAQILVRATGGPTDFTASFTAAQDID